MTHERLGEERASEGGFEASPALLPTPATGGLAKLLDYYGEQERLRTERGGGVKAAAQPGSLEMAIDTFGAEAAEPLIKLQVDDFLIARDGYVSAAERYNSAFSDSRALLQIDPDSMSDPDLREKLIAVQDLYRGNGGR